MKTKAKIILSTLLLAFGVLIITGFSQSISSDSGDIQSIKEKTPLGTVMTSTLSFVELTKSIDENSNFNPKKSKWAPADGRDIDGSDYFKLTSKGLAPDLRGQFIRGKNRFLNDGLEYTHYTNGKDVGKRQIKRLYSYQIDKVGEHVHPNEVFWEDQKGGNASRGSNANSQSKSKPHTDGNINSGKETRPKNMNVYYYIRINY